MEISRWLEVLRPWLFVSKSIDAVDLNFSLDGAGFVPALGKPFDLLAEDFPSPQVE